MCELNNFVKTSKINLENDKEHYFFVFTAEQLYCVTFSELMNNLDGQVQ